MLAALCLVISFLANCGARAPAQAVIKINAQKTYQTMSGWEATAQAGQSHSRAFPNYKEKLFDLITSDLGINRLRVEINSGAENSKDYFPDFLAGKITEEQKRAHLYEIINDNDDPLRINPAGFQFSELDDIVDKLVLPLRKRLQDRGERLYVNLNYVDFGCCRGASNIRHRNAPEEYAEFILATYQHLQSKYGFVPDAVEVVLEPDNNTGWTPTEIGRAVVATANRLRAGNFNPAFIVPGTTNAANAPVFIDEINEVAGAMRYVSEFSYHRYCCASDEVLQRIADRAAHYNKKVGMLEFIGADYETLHQDIKAGMNSSWQQYTLAGPLAWGADDGSRYYLIDDKNTAQPVITMGSRAKFLRQYFKFVRMGALRVEAITSNRSLDPLAFINTDKKYVVVIKADGPGAVSIEGLPSGSYGINYTTARQYDASAADATISSGQALKANIPDAGVLTIYAKT